MSGMDLIWLFFALAAIQPVIRQKMIEASRQRMIARIEQIRGSRLILLVHRQETMGLLGFPIMRYIDIHDSEEVLRAIQMTDPNMPIDLVLHTPGGLVLAAMQIARAIREHPGKVTVVVPHYAMSGGTLIALAADEILMSPYAVLGPVDPQLGQWPAASVIRAVQKKPIDKVDDQTLILADQAEMAVRQVRQSVQWLLEKRMDKDRAEQLARMLSEGYWTHDHPITADAARELGLPINTQIPSYFLELMAMYPQPIRRTTSVEYVPVPYRGEKPPRAQL